MIQEKQITPTASQEVLIRKIKNFLESDHKYFRIIGRAGSGKTTAIKLALEDFLAKQKKGYTACVGIALSHKAKNVLGNSIDTTRTFASAYGYKEVIRQNGSRDFEPAKFHAEPPVGHMDIPIFVHDEVSQYSHKMLSIVLKETSMFSKVIFMGDNAQLPPIDSSMKPDEDSPVFTMELPEECQHELTERVRQKYGNPILDLSDMIIEEIFGSQNLNRVIQEILRPKLCDGQGYLILPEKDLFDTYIQTNDYLKNKVIAYRNKCIDSTNSSIRDIVFPDTFESLIKGDLVFMTNNFKSDSPRYKVQNSDEFVVKEVIKKHVNNNHGRPVECYFGEIDVPMYYESYIITPTEHGIDTYNKIVSKLTADAKQNGSLWKQLYSFKEMFCEYTMGYAINVYRSQGSTYDNVFLDLNDILNTGPLTPKRKLQSIYTALTRAQEIVYFIKP